MGAPNTIINEIEIFAVCDDGIHIGNIDDFVKDWSVSVTNSFLRK